MKWLKILLIILTSIILFVALLFVGATTLLSSKRLTPKINEFCSKYIPKGYVEFDTVSLSLFEEFPYLDLKLSNGRLVSEAYEGENIDPVLASVVPDEAHTLLSFKEFSISLNIPQLLLSKVDVRRVRVVEPNLYAYVSPWGTKNWDIFSDPDEPEDTTSMNLHLNIARASVRNGYFIYDDRESETSYECSMERLFARGKLTNDIHNFELQRARFDNWDIVAYLEKTQTLAKVHLDSLRVSERDDEKYAVQLDTYSYLMLKSDIISENMPLSITGNIGADLSGPIKFYFDSTLITITEVPMEIEGKISFDSDKIFTNLNCSSDSIDFGKAISYLYPGAFNMTEGIETDLTASIKSTVTGKYELSTGTLPFIKLDISVPGGMLHYPGLGVDMEHLEMDASLNYDPYQTDSTWIKFRKLDIDATGLKLSGIGHGDNLLNNPHFKLDMIGNADITKLSSLFLKKQDITARGNMDIDIKGDFRLKDLSMTGIGNTTITGKLTTDRLLIDIPADTVFAMIDKGSFNFSSGEVSTKDTLVKRGTRAIRLSVSADSANVNFKEKMNGAVSKLFLSAKTVAQSLSGDTTSIHPMAGKISASTMRLTASDSTRIRTRSLNCDFNVLPSKEDKTIPTVSMRANARTLSYRNIDSWYSLRNGIISLSGTMSGNNRLSTDPVARARRERRLDSLQRIYPDVIRDSLYAHDRRIRMSAGGKESFGNEGNLNFTVNKSLGAILREWNANGSIIASGGRIISPLLPLRNTLKEVNLTFTTNEVNFNNTKITSGKSHLDITGKISGLRRALTRNGRIKANIALESDTLNLNELLGAFRAGSAYSSSSDKTKESIATIANEEQLQEILAENIDTSGHSDLIIIPSNLDMNLKLHIGSGEYGNIILDDVEGSIAMKDRCLQIKDLKAVTQAGDLALTALYSTKSKNDIRAGFDMELKQIQVEKFIDLIPSVDTLLPMLRSFKGVIDCQLAATSEIDTNMNFILPSLNGVCRISGKNMVLLDGETFGEIAKMLRFKDRKDSSIDSISVEMLMYDNMIDVFPFMMRIDRYQAAISGIHNLDMSFNYHISVIKSPLPIKIGLNIFGTFDDIKYKIGKAKYKNAKLPVYSMLIDSSRINLRKEMDEIFRKGIEIATITQAAPNSASTSSLPKQTLSEPQTEELTESEKLLLLPKSL